MVFLRVVCNMLTISTKLSTAKRVGLNYDYEFMVISCKFCFTICYVSLLIDIECVGLIFMTISIPR